MRVDIAKFSRGEDEVWLVRFGDGAEHVLAEEVYIDGEPLSESSVRVAAEAVKIEVCADEETGRTIVYVYTLHGLSLPGASTPNR